MYTMVLSPPSRPLCLLIVSFFCHANNFRASLMINDLCNSMERTYIFSYSFFALSYSKGRRQKKEVQTQRGSLWFCPNEFDHQKKKDKAKKIKNVAKSAKIEVILGSVLLPIMNYVRSA